MVQALGSSPYPIACGYLSMQRPYVVYRWVRRLPGPAGLGPPSVAIVGAAAAAHGLHTRCPHSPPRLPAPWPPRSWFSGATATGGTLVASACNLLRSGDPVVSLLKTTNPAGGSWGCIG